MNNDFRRGQIGIAQVDKLFKSRNKGYEIFTVF